MTTSVNDSNTPEATGDKPAAPVPGTPEYESAMASLYRERNGLPPVETPAADETPTGDSQAQRPEWVPEKFWDAEKGEVRTEDLAKSYAELEAKNSKAADSDDLGTDEESSNEEEAAVEDFIKKSGLKVEDLRNKIMTTGKLDDSDIEALAKSGAPKELVAEYVELAKFFIETSKEKRTSAAADRVGGGDKLDAIMDWAAKNLSDDEKRSYNTMLAGEAWPAALDTLRSKMEASSKTHGEPNLLNNRETIPGSPSVGYETRADMVKDMKNPLYHSDPAFRREVEQKVAHAVWNRGR